MRCVVTSGPSDPLGECRVPWGGHSGRADGAADPEAPSGFSSHTSGGRGDWGEAPRRLAVPPRGAAASGSPG